MTTVFIIDYGCGNLASIKNMFLKIGIDSTIVYSPDEIVDATHIILPGVGSFDNGVENLKRSGFYEFLKKQRNLGKTKVLGICLGMQLLMESSEEGGQKGLGLIEGKAANFSNFVSGVTVPSMGWKITRFTDDAKMNAFLGLDYLKFYFVHSFFVKTKNAEDSFMQNEYGGVQFDSGVRAGNITGVQFHPEKSHKYGMAFLSAYIEDKI